jgi:hypothetical protein
MQPGERDGHRGLSRTWFWTGMASGKYLGLVEVEARENPSSLFANAGGYTEGIAKSIAV